MGHHVARLAGALLLLAGWAGQAEGLGRTLGDCDRIASAFRNTCDRAGGALDSLAGHSGTAVTCTGSPACGGTVNADGSCTWQRKLCVTCREVGGVVRIRVQSNGLPASCYSSPVEPKEQDNDFEVDFNVPVVERVAPMTQDEVNEAVCDIQAHSRVPADSHFELLGTSTLRVASGIALDGVVYMNQMSALGVDPFYPSVFAEVTDPASVVEKVDLCLGHPQAAGIYHYHTPSPCVADPTSQPVAPCNARNGCTDFATQAVSTYKRELTVIGLAKDGHVMYGPYLGSGAEAGASGLDVCNGAVGLAECDDSYAYFATKTFPYLSGCFGAGGRPSFTPQCTTNGPSAYTALQRPVCTPATPATPVPVVTPVPAPPTPVATPAPAPVTTPQPAAVPTPETPCERRQRRGLRCKETPAPAPVPTPVPVPIATRVPVTAAPATPVPTPIPTPAPVTTPQPAAVPTPETPCERRQRRGLRCKETPAPAPTRVPAPVATPLPVPETAVPDTAAPATGAPATDGPAPVGRTLPNVVLFMPDDMAFLWDEAPAGTEVPAERPPTPNMDRVRAEGAVFERAYTAAPKCAPSRFSLLTGRYPSRGDYARFVAGRKHNGDAGWDGRVNIDVPTTKLADGDVSENLQTALGRRGYETIHSGKWHLFPSKMEEAYLADYEALVRDVAATGFTQVASAYVTNMDADGATDGKGHHWSHNPEWMVNTSLAAVGDAVRAQKPFFLHMTPTGPHNPKTQAAMAFDMRATPAGMLEHVPQTTMRKRTDVWAAAGDLTRRESVQETLASHMWVDDALGAVLQGLEGLGVLDNTVVVLCTDHGVSGKSSVAETGTRILQAVRYPVEVPAGTRVGSVVVNTDTAATLLDYAGASSTRALDGVSWRAAAGGVVPLSTIPKAMEMLTDRAVIVWPYKYVVPVGVAAAGQLYDLSEDEGEERNLAGDGALQSVLRSMQEYMQCHDQSTSGHPAAAECTMPEIPNPAYVSAGGVRL